MNLISGSSQSSRRKVLLEVLKDKWAPDNTDSKHHQLARTYYYRTAFNNWIEILEEALRFALEQMNAAKVYDALCHREEFSPKIKARFPDCVQTVRAPAVGSGADSKRHRVSKPRRSSERYFQTRGVRLHLPDEALRRRRQPKLL